MNDSNGWARTRVKVLSVASLTGLVVGCEAVPVSGQKPDRVQAVKMLQPSSIEIDLGEVRPGGQKNAIFRLANNGTTEIEIARIRTSCACLRVELTKTTVRPSEPIEAKVLLDLRVEPDFTGSLGVDVEGFGPAGEKLFAVLVLVAVLVESKGPQKESKGRLNPCYPP
jgi:hypothetical protein